MRKILFATATLAALGGWSALRRYQALRPELSRVAPELRNPLLPLLTTSHGPRSLPLARWFNNIESEPGDGVEAVERRIGSPEFGVLITRPTSSGDSGARPGVLHIHGGGFIFGSPRNEAATCGTLTRELGAVVVSPDYRLAPEHPFPAALDDCMATLHWMRAHADEIGIDPDRIAVTGSSAGGGLAAAVAQRAFDEGITLRAQALAYPAVDDRTTLRDQPGRGRFLWPAKSNTFAWTSYLGRAPRLSDAPRYAAPARRDDLSGLAPAWVGVGELDLLYDESVEYAARLRACGVPCEVVTVPGMYHAADGLMTKAPAMAEFRRSIADFLGRHL
ncbi:alpha/beta hydrolase [Mycobacterium sp. AMU20-3851]|uniref:alpha/beta hydrolase n=1 Tax=Mycobacterium sp. AMU20-3851 TaxID=3122055 RepID=UPI0037543122